MGRILATAALTLLTGCAVGRQAGPLASDPVIDARQLVFPARGTRVVAIARTSDEDIAAAIHLVLAGRLAALDGGCDQAAALFGTARSRAPGFPSADDWREYKVHCDPLGGLADGKASPWAAHDPLVLGGPTSRR